jgi:hypothetical protein
MRRRRRRQTSLTSLNVSGYRALVALMGGPYCLGVMRRLGSFGNTDHDQGVRTVQVPCGPFDALAPGN